MTATLVYDGPVEAAVTGDWVAVPTSQAYLIQEVGYGNNALRVQFSLDGVDAFDIDSSSTSRPARGVFASSSPSTAWLVTGVPVNYVRFQIASGAAGQSAKVYIQEM